MRFDHLIGLALFCLGAGSCAVQDPVEESCLATDAPAVQGIVAAREAFNRAIAEGDLAAIRDVLAEDVVLVTGTDSAAFIGRVPQLNIWAEDFADADRLVFARSAGCVVVSNVASIAMERGDWQGAKAGDTENTVGGEYSAKWRHVDGEWLIEAETYLTTVCSGELCR